MVADGEEERSERVPLRASLGRHEDIAVAVPRLLVEEEETARDHSERSPQTQPVILESEQPSPLPSPQAVRVLLAECQGEEGQ